jgi:dTDP-4-amino-4,6-dideoxygalactose transaminase
MRATSTSAQSGAGTTAPAGRHADVLTIDGADLGEARALAAEPAATMDVPFVDVRRTYEAQRSQIDLAIARVLERGDFVLGDAVAAFEEAFAAYCGARHAIGVDSGYSALELILRAHGIGPGDEVITAANTFVATVGAIDIVGARAVLVDVTPDTYTLDPDAVAAAITPATRAIIPVHLYGQPADMDAVNAVAARHGLLVVEDACQAHGAVYRGQRTGVLGHAAAFSFYPAKNLGAFGDGGMVVTSDAATAETVRKLRNLGSVEKYRHDVKGYNRRLDTLHAAVLSVKLARLDRDNASRRRTAAIYDSLLHGLPVHRPRTRPDVEHVHHLYVIEADDRDALRRHLATVGVATGIHYPVPIHLQPAYDLLADGTGSFPTTEAGAGRILSLPMYPDMPLAAIAHTAGWITRFYAG